MTEWTDKFVDTGAYRTHYVEIGEGPPLILLHGGGAGADGLSNWRDTLPIFARKHRVFAMDMVGFGQTDAPDPSGFVYSQGARNEQCVAFIEALNLRNVSLVGNSMGGSTALGVAMLRPDLPRNLVLMGSSGLNRQIGTALRPMVNYDFTVEGMRKIASMLTNPGFSASEEMIQRRYENSVRPDIKRAYTATMGWVKEQGGLHYEDAEIAAVKTRTLVFNGKDDRVVPMGEAFRFIELLENASGYFLAKCGHWAMIERPEVFTSVTLSFLEAAH